MQRLSLQIFEKSQNLDASSRFNPEVWTRLKYWLNLKSTVKKKKKNTL